MPSAIRYAHCVSADLYHIEFEQSENISNLSKASARAFNMPMSKVPLRYFCHSKVRGISVLLNVSLFESNSGKQIKKKSHSSQQHSNP